jgi:class 3 adenylate cyclase
MADSARDSDRSAKVAPARRQTAVHMSIACAIGSLLGGAAALAWPRFAVDTRIGLALVAVIAAAFYGLAVATAAGAGDSRRWPIVASLFEVTLAGVAVAVIAVFEGPTAVAAGAGGGAFMATIALATTRMRASAVLVATGASLVAWLAIDLFLVRPALPADPSWWWQLERYGWLLVVGLIGAGAAHAIRERTHVVSERMQQRLEQELGRYVSQEVARAILRGKVSLGKPERRTVTVLFCDLRGFTFLCERERPEDVVNILETFYQRAFAIVQKHGGTINKILGDGLLALFNAPSDLPNHAIAASDAASEIIRMMYRLRERGGVWTHLAAGIGLDTGAIVVGAIGSWDRAEYTAIGSPVNRAARLQSLADKERRRIILSESTRSALGHQRMTESIGVVELKGFAGPETAYSLPFRRPRASGVLRPTARPPA